MEAADDAVAVVVEEERPRRLMMMTRNWLRMIGSGGKRWCWRGRRECGVKMAQNDVKMDQFTQLNLTALAKTRKL